MSHKQKKRFLPFLDPVRNFLHADLKTMDDFLIIARFKPKITRFNFINVVWFFLIMLLYVLLMGSQFLFIGTHVTFSAFLSFLLTNARWLLLSLLGVAVPPQRQLGLVFLWGLIWMVISMAWMVREARRAFRDAHGLFQVHRMTPQQRSQFVLKKFLRFSFPTWMSPSITYEPSLEELQSMLRESEQTVAARTQALAARLTEEADTEEETGEYLLSLEKRLTLTDCIALTLQKPDGEQLTMELDIAAASLVGFLATRPRGEQVPRKALFEANVYRSGQGEVFKQHHSRLDAQIFARARKAGFFPEKTADQEETSITNSETRSPQEKTEEGALEKRSSAEAWSKEHIHLLENEVQGHLSLWRISPDWEVEVFPFLTRFYQQVALAEALPEPSSLLSLEELRKSCRHLMREYGIESEDERSGGIGFLAKHVEHGASLWRWARPIYEQYQVQCIQILKYAIRRESDYLNTLAESTTPEKKKESYKVIKWLAQLYGWRAIVATGLDPKDGGVFSEGDMMKCLSYYKRVRKLADADFLYQRYCQCRSWLDRSYKPGEALQKRVAEVLGPQQDDSLSQKEDSDRSPSGVEH